jgi:hypothetical protein
MLVKLLLHFMQCVHLCIICYKHVKLFSFSSLMFKIGCKNIHTTPLEQWFSTFLRPRPRKFIFYKARAWYNWCQVLVPGHGLAVEKHCPRVFHVSTCFGWWHIFIGNELGVMSHFCYLWWDEYSPYVTICVVSRIFQIACLVRRLISCSVFQRSQTLTLMC